MATQAQIDANRANAQKSTGPRTSEGKAAVSQNAVRHGLLAEQVVIAGEDPGQFESHRQSLIADISPVGDYEKVLAERAAELVWKLWRAGRMQTETIGTLLAKEASATHLQKLTRKCLPKNVREGMIDADQGQTPLGRAIVRDYANYRVLDRLGLYERRIERSLFKTMNELERLRVVREMQPATEDSKSEARSTKSETNTNVQNSNDKNGLERVREIVMGEGVDEGQGGGTRGLRTHPTNGGPDTAGENVQTNPIAAPGVAKTAGITG